MAISINWNTQVISVPRADLPVISVGPPEIREHDINAFRLELKSIEDDEGMPFLDTHRHNTESTLAGTTFARQVEIINGYRVEYEAGLYAVRLIGANNNIPDVFVVNGVSIVPTNSAGLISIDEVANRVLDVWRRLGLDPSNPTDHNAAYIRVPSDGSLLNVTTIEEEPGVVRVRRIP